jgi:endoglucanase
MALLTRLWGRSVATYPQQAITNFSPGAGPVGTVVVLNGSGFTGSNLAWVGTAKNVPVTVISDTRAQLTIPAAATSGAIGIFNPLRSAFTATAFTVSTSAVTYAQQSISNFSPSSGPVGTVVTINGSGFTGSNLAWVGTAKNVPVTVISDTQAQLTIPAAATSGAIGIFNPLRSAFTATAFTVSTSAVTYVQQLISDFSPSSGPVGTVVTINGSGFTGSNLAWIGAARNIPVTVISDTRALVTVAAGSTSGAIGIFNPVHAAFTATSFTVQ